MDQELNTKPKSTLTLDFRIISIVLAMVVVAMLAIWMPWKNAGTSDRTITVRGESTVSAEPDEYVFYPTYEFKDTDKDVALANSTKKSEEVVAKIKELGVEDSKIKTNASGYDYPLYPERTDDETTYTLQLTVTVDDRELAQKVQDYLLTTTPTGSVSPQATFSEEKRKQLESEARDEATKDARSKADQSARNLGFKVGKVKSVEDGAGFGGIVPLRGTSVGSSEDSTTSLAIQPGENDLHYSVTVIYYVR